MQILLSCAKTMGRTAGCPPAVTRPAFAAEAETCVRQLLAYGPAELGQMLHVGGSVTADAALRFRRFFAPETQEVPAILAYTGIVFRYLDPTSFSEADFAYAQRHLFITSFLYGLLRPLDGIRPYRLEGDVRLPDPDGPTRFDYWKPRLTDRLIEAVRGDDGVLVNLASAEMKRLFDWRRVCAAVRVVTPEFRVADGDRLRSVVVYTKMCRGAMTRFILRNRLSAPSDLSRFEPSPDNAVGQLPVVVSGIPDAG